MDWNVVVTVRDRHYQEAVALLRQFGELEKTRYYDVLVMKVPDIGQFLVRLQQRLAEHPEGAACLGRVSPCSETFAFQSPEEFEEKARRAARGFVDALAGKRFHVRMHRRGFKGTLHSMQEEQFLDHFLLTALEEAGAPGKITFDDPDAIVTVETVDTQAGMALWTREQLKQYPFLRPD